jgi:hypothetical protein
MSAIRAVVAVLATLFTGGAFVLYVVAARQGLRARRRRAFLRATAKVTSVGWEAKPDELGVLRVVFDVDGRSSTLTDLGDEERRNSERAELLQTFAVGTSHAALVDPLAATPPVLVTGRVQSFKVPLIIGVIFQVLSAVMGGLAWYLGQPGNLLAKLLG